ncbi:MAG: hypothetical protein AB8G86_28675 [Saprospiraceae bacterium]
MKIYLNKGERIEHWVNFFFLLIPLSFFGFITIYEPASKGEIPTFGLIVIGMFFLFLRHKLLSTKLEVYKSNLTEEQFKQANHAAAKLNDWIVLSNRKNYFSAIKGTNWQWDGIKITAILKNEKLYLNSMVNPSTRSNPFLFKLNKRNKLELIRQYQSILKGNNVREIVNEEIEKKEEEFWNESEWTLGNIMKRVIGYGLSILFIMLAFGMMSEGEIQGLIYGIMILGFCGSYIFYDIKVILEKKKKARL